MDTGDLQPQGPTMQEGPELIVECVTRIHRAQCRIKTWGPLLKKKKKKKSEFQSGNSRASNQMQGPPEHWALYHCTGGTLATGSAGVIGKASQKQ